MPLLLLLLLLKNELSADGPEIAKVVLQALAIFVERCLESLDVGLPFKCGKALHGSTSGSDGRKKRPLIRSADQSILIKGKIVEGRGRQGLTEATYRFAVEFMVDRVKAQAIGRKRWC